jgi:hypothetical protein
MGPEAQRRTHPAVLAYRLQPAAPDGGGSMKMPKMNTIIARGPDAIYIRIPREIASDITGGCDCERCKAHPHETPQWDALCVPLEGDLKRDYTHTVHMPDPARSMAVWARQKAQLARRKAEAQ